jgi:hypothetical protein|tara:strand:+ start:356 stop:700 length:345 start_codon:yes stop_codon:yes gene_type:complete
MAFNGSNALQVWANVRTDGTNAVNDSYNVSSFSNPGEDAIQINLTTAFANTNYCVVMSCIENDGGSSQIGSRTPRVANPTRKNLVTGSIVAQCCDFSADQRSVFRIFIAAFGDQ